MHHFILKLNSSISYDFIHVGKCGGSSLGAILSKNNIKFKSIHAPKLKPQYHPHKIYIVAYRDPIKRLFSILNWRYHVLLNKKIPSIANSPKHLLNSLELKFLDSLESGDQLCSWLKANPDRVHRMLGTLGHYNKGLHWYLSDIISKSQTSQFKAIVQTETFDEDMQRFFQVNTKNMRKQKSNYPKKFYIPTDSESISILKDLLTSEYKIFEALTTFKRKI